MSHLKLKREYLDTSDIKNCNAYNE